MNGSDSEQNQVKIKNKKIAGVLAILFGIFGVHRFYIGRSDGAFYIILSIMSFFPLVFIFSVCEGIKYLVISEEKWNKILNPHLRNEKEKEKEKKRALIGKIFFILVAIGWSVFIVLMANKVRQDYDARMQASIMAKAQISEFISSTTELKFKLFEHHIFGGGRRQPEPLSKFADDYNHNHASKYVEPIIIYVPNNSGNIIIQAKFKSDTGVSEFIRGKTLSLSYVRGKSDSGHWQCGLNSIGVTEIEEYYLPGSCR